MKRWYSTFERCPKCGGHMIINRYYEECSELRCTYIKARGFGQL